MSNVLFTLNQMIQAESGLDTYTGTLFNTVDSVNELTTHFSKEEMDEMLDTLGVSDISDLSEEDVREYIAEKEEWE